MGGKTKENLLNIIKNDKLAAAVFLLAAAYLLFWNLDERYLWQDEAQTALISKTVVSDGIPRCTDGKNSFSQELGAECGDNYIYKWHTWLPFYWQALFFKIFGINTFTARFSFALFGLMTMLMTLLIAKKISPAAGLPLFTALILCLMVPFLLAAKQSRYYSMAMFFSTACILAYISSMKKPRFSILTFFSLAALFYTYSIYAVILGASLMAHSFIYRKVSPVKTGLVLAGVGIVALPWILYTGDINYTEIYPHLLTFSSLLLFFPDYLYVILMYIFNPFMAVALATSAFFVVKGRFGEKNNDFSQITPLLIIYFLFAMLFLSFASPAVFFRYLSPILPVAALLMGAACCKLYNKNRAVVFVLIVVSAIWWKFPHYIAEINSDFDGPIEGIVKYLKKNGSDEETVAITYGDLPVKFYTGMRVVGGLTGESLEPIRNADWIIMRKHVISGKDYKVRRFIIENVNRDKYESTAIDYPDMPFENREDPRLHRFFPEKGGGKVLIWKRKNNDWNKEPAGN